MIMILCFMRCQNPIRIRNPAIRSFIRSYHERYGCDVSQSVLDNFIAVNHYERTMIIPCGKCLYCYERKQSEWLVRLQHEARFSTSKFFVTLTYSDDNLPLRGDVSKRDCQLFLKRLRKNVNFRLRYFLISEYTPTGTRRPHYHMALFFSDFVSFEDVNLEVSKSWNKGFVEVTELNDGRMKYISTYCIKFFNDPPVGNCCNFMLCSRKPFIGNSYIDSETLDYHRSTLQPCVRVNGYYKNMPRIYRNKIFDDEMKCVLRYNGQILANKEFELYQQRKLDSYHDSLDCEHSKYHQVSLDYVRAWDKFKKSKLL